MSELNYKELQEKGVFDVPFRSFQFMQKQQAKIDELQKQVDYASQEVKGLERFTGEDCIADFEVLQGAVSYACKRLEKALRGTND